jgi:putative polyhydroxyalkanoate system protein
MVAHSIRCMAGVENRKGFMADIEFQFEHDLGLEAARHAAAQWVMDAQNQWGMKCQTHMTEESDTIVFTRSGVNGQLLVNARRFHLEIRLGFLLKGFRQRIEADLRKNLEQWHVAAGGGASQAGVQPLA